MIQAELHDGEILEFPDGTPDAVVSATAKRITLEKRARTGEPEPTQYAKPAGDTAFFESAQAGGAAATPRPVKSDVKSDGQGSFYRDTEPPPTAAQVAPVTGMRNPRRPRAPQDLVKEPPGTFQPSVMAQEPAPLPPDEGPVAGTIRGAGRFVGDVAAEAARGVGRAAALPVRLGQRVLGVEGIPSEQPAAGAAANPQPPTIGPRSPTSVDVPPVPAHTTDPAAIASNVVRNLPSIPGRIYTRGVEAGAGNVQAIAEAAGAPDVAASAAARGADAARRAQGIEARNPTMDQFVPKAIQSGLESAPQTLSSAALAAVTPGGLPAKLTASLLPFFMGAQGESYAQLRRQGYSSEQARFYSTVQGAAEAGTELIPMRKLIDVMAAPQGQFLRNWFNYMWKEGGTEEVNTVINHAVDLATTRPDLTPQQMAQELLDTAGSVAVGGIATGPVMGGVNRMARRGEPAPAVVRPNPRGPDDVSGFAPNPMSQAVSTAMSQPPTRSGPGPAAPETSPQPGSSAGIDGLDGIFGAPPKPPATVTPTDLHTVMADPRPLPQIRTEDAEQQVRPDIEQTLQEQQAVRDSVGQMRARIEQQGYGGASPEIDSLRTQWAFAGLSDEEWNQAWTAPIEGTSTPKDPVVVRTSADIDAAVERIDLESTPAQREAGNDRRAHFRFADDHPLAGIGDVSIETAKGKVREATDGSWVSPPLGAHYGYIKVAQGMDGDKLDAFFGPELDAPGVFVFDTINPETKEPDEHKVMIGFNDVSAAVDAFVASYSDRAMARIGHIEPMPVAQFVDRVRNGDWSKPIGYVKQAAPADPGEEPEVKPAPTTTQPNLAAEKNRQIREFEAAGFLSAQRGEAREPPPAIPKPLVDAWLRGWDRAGVAHPNGGVTIDQEPPAPRLPAPEPPKAPEPAAGDVEAKYRDTIARHIAQAKEPVRIQVARRLYGEALGRDLQPEDSKRADELIEQAIVLLGRDVVRRGRLSGVDDGTIFARLVEIYERQPILGMRSSTSVANQAYSTPLPIAFVASRLAGIETDTQAYEPTGGHGMLLIEVGTKQGTGRAFVNELDPARAAFLKTLGLGRVREGDAIGFDPRGDGIAQRGAEVVVANPPFGAVDEGQGSKSFTAPTKQAPGGSFQTTAIDHAIALQALEAMADDGSAVLIVGGLAKTATTADARKEGYRGKQKREFYLALYRDYNVTEHVTVAGELYERQGAGWPVDIIVIHGRGKSERALPGVEPPRIIESFDELGKLLAAGNAVGIPTERPAGPSAGPGPAQGGGGSAPSGRGPAPGPRQRPPDVGSGPRTVPAPEPPPSNEPPGQHGAGNGPAGVGGKRASDLGDVSDEDIESLVDGAVSQPHGTAQHQALPEGARAPAGKRDDRTDAGGSAGAVSLPGGNESLKQAGQHAAAAVKEGLAGLDALFGGKGTLGSGPAFDEQTYAKAKPHFEAAYKEAVAAGKSLKEFVDFILKRYGEAVAQYLKRWLKDLAEQQRQKKEPPKQEEETEQQVAYLPGSKVAALGTLAPANMRDAMREALDRLKERVGDLDEYVAKELGYKVDEVETYFAAEQVDALELALDNISRDSGFIIGDQTGIGKGRVNAGIIRWAIRNGKTPIFVTHKPNLYKDIYRDLIDIGMRDEIEGRVLMTNAEQKVPLDDLEDDDPEKEWLTTQERGKHNAALEEMIANGSIGNYQMVVTTYDQMNMEKGQYNIRNRFLEAFTRGGVLALDESHNAGGSGTEKMVKGRIMMDRARFVRGLVEMAGAVFYSSATYAKRPDVMDLYSKTDMRLSVANLKKLAETITRGGVPMQQVVASMLAKAGQYVRRERSFAGIEYKMEARAVDKVVVDNSATIMREIIVFDKLKQPGIKDIKDGAAAEGAAVGYDGSNGRAGAESTNFTSIMHNLVNQLLLGLKIPAAVQAAKDALERNEKPILTVANTMESMLDRFVEANDIKPGDLVNANFGDLFLRYLDRTREVLIKKPWSSDKGVKHWMTDEELGEAATAQYNKIKEMIEGIDWSGLPFSPIDMLHHELRKLGLKTGEITGRGQTIDYSGDKGPTYKIRPAKEIGARGRIDTLKGYNNGTLGALIINQAGSTGLSAHASPKNGKDVRKRHMIIIQAEGNIDTHVQILGRIHRTGQIVLPSYIQLVADVPAEKRPAAVLAKKMASLSANTTGARKTAMLDKDAPDFLNVYGDQVAADIMWDNPELHAELGSPLKVNDTADGFVEEDAARRITGRMPVLPRVRAEEIYELIESEYAALLERTNALGENALEAKTFDFDAKPTGEQITLFEGTKGPDENLVYTHPQYGEIRKGDSVHAIGIGELHNIQGVSKHTPENGPYSETGYEILTNGDFKGTDEPFDGARSWIPIMSVDRVMVGPRHYSDANGIPVSPFSEGARAVEMDVKRLGKPWTSEQVAKKAAENLGLTDIDRESVLHYGQQHAETQLTDIDPEFRDWLDEQLSSYEDAAKRANAEQRHLATYMKLRDVVTNLPIGQTVELIEPSGTVFSGAVLNVERKGIAKNPAANGAWKVTFAVADAARQITLPISQISIAGEGGLVQVNQAEFDTLGAPIWDTFDHAQSVSHEKRIIALGNLLAAYDKLGRGQIINFTTQEGKVEQGILMPRGYTLRDAEAKSSKDLTTPAQALKAFEPGVELINPDEHVRIRRHAGDVWIHVPGTKKDGARYFLNKAITDAIGRDFYKKPAAKEMIARFPEDRLEAVMKALYGLDGFFLRVARARQAGDATGGNAVHSIGGVQLSVGLPAKRAGERRRPLSGIPTPPQGTGLPPAERVREIIERLREHLGLPQRQGRLRSHRAAGQYSRESGVIRQSVIDDMEVFAHEAGHGISQLHRAWLLPMQRRARTDLEAMAYPGAAKRVLLEEGFAEFMRSYVTNRPYALSHAPVFAQQFRDELNKRDPELAAALDDATYAYSAWLAAPSGEVIDANIVDSAGKPNGLIHLVKRMGLGGAVAEIAHRGYTQHVDQLHPVARATTELREISETKRGHRQDLDAAADPYKRARLTPDATASGQMDILYGVRPHNSIAVATRGLTDALELALGHDRSDWTPDRMRQFESYLISRRAVVEWERFDQGKIPYPPTKEGVGDHTTNIGEKELANPTFAAAADIIYEWSTALLQKKRDAGLITTAQFNVWLKEHKDYVPFLRDRSDDTKTSGQGNVTGRASISKAFRGSERAIVSPIRSLMEDAYTTANMIARNEAIKALAMLAKNAGPPGGKIAEEIPATQTERQSVSALSALEQIQKNVDWSAFSQRDEQMLNQAIEMLKQTAEDQPLPSVSRYTAGIINERGEPIVYWWQHGKRHALRLADREFGLELYQALTGLGREHSNLIIQMLALPSAVLRYGVTVDPSFFLANIMRDQISAWVLSPAGYLPFVDNVQGMYGALTHSDMQRIYNSFGGIMGGSNVAALDRRKVEMDFRALRNKGVNVRRFASWRALAEFTELSETGTRLGLFKRAYEAAKARGLSDYAAAIEAAYEARDYIDFGRHGSKMLIARRIATFLNAGIQGVDKAARVLGGQGQIRHALTAYVKHGAGAKLSRQETRQLAHSARAWAKVALLASIGLLLAMLYKDDEEYEEFSDYLRATHWFFKVDGHWFSYPKPFELGFLSNIGEIAFDALYKDRPSEWKRLWARLAPILLPPLNVPAVQVPIEMWANRRFMDNAPIVPDYLLGREGHLQYTAAASELAKSMGNATNLSPNMIQHAIVGFGGSLAKSALDLASVPHPNAANKGLDDMWVIRRFVRDPSRGAESTRQFWSLMERVAGKYRSADLTFSHLAGAGGPGKAEDYLKKLPESMQAYVVIRRMSAINPPRQGSGAPSLRLFHPLDRAAEAIRIIGSYRAEVRESKEFTPEQKRLLDDALSRAAMIEARNALIITGHESWSNKKMMDADANMAKLRAASTAAADELQERMERKKLPPLKEVADEWPKLRAEALGDMKSSVMEAAGAGITSKRPRKGK